MSHIQNKGLRVGVVGATGMVGEVFMRILGERNLPISILKPFASEASRGQSLRACGKDWNVEVLAPGCFDGLDLVFFSSGDAISEEWAPRAVAAGAYAIDNSAAFRMNEKFPLIVPEVNGDLLDQLDKPTIIANPNCSTIQLVVALQAIKKFKLKCIKVASYQSVSGAGKAGREELLAQTEEQLKWKEIKTKPQAFPHEIAFNCVPQIGGFNDSGFCSEEVKIMNETKKILRLPDLKVSAFTVRVPTLNSHSEAVWVTFDQVVTREQIFSALENAQGLVFHSQEEPTDYPTARMASGLDPVYVGRVHQDLSEPETWLMWIVADNVLKGAALNGLQIAEALISSGKINA